MGLIKQIDDRLGVLFKFLEQRDLARDTVVVFCSDHGDYLGDHWLGEKDLFHEVSVKTPLIIADPSPGADATRGTVCDALAEAIDLAPTFVEMFGGKPQRHVLSGRSLMPLLRGAPIAWRDFVVSEYDYSMLDVRRTLNRPIAECRLFMVFDGRWKYVHAPGFPPMLHDLANDPHEFADLGRDPGYEAERARLKEALLQWALTDHARITMPDERIAGYLDGAQLKAGILIGYWDAPQR